MVKVFVPEKYKDKNEYKHQSDNIYLNLKEDRRHLSVAIEKSYVKQEDKKYKYLCDRDILKAFYNMQFMNMKIPKGIRRKVKGIIHKCEKEQPWWYKEV